MTDRNDLEEKLNRLNPKKSSVGSIIATVLLIVFTAVMLVVAYLNTYVFFLVEVSGESMLPTLNSGDVVIVNRKEQAVKGDIVIIDGEKPSAYLIKRVIAVGGDTVELENGYVVVNGETLQEDYVIKEGATNKTGQKDKWILSENEVFYLGDNRLNSRDSRDDSYGTCTVEDLVGVVQDWSMDNQKINRFLYNLGR